MKRLQANRWERILKPLSWSALCVVLTWTFGCQSMMAAKAKKEMMERNKFSCGEKIPGRMP